MEPDPAGADADLALSRGNRIPADEIVERASRSSGPGGQHVNTSSTRVTLRWSVRDSRGLRADDRARLLERLRPRLTTEGVLIVHADRSRSRARNRQAARERLREIVDTALHQSPPRRPTRPTRASRARRLEAKRQRGQLKARRRPPAGEGD
jgi:ribosome-associated protein